MNPRFAHALSRPAACVVFYGTSLTKSGGWVEIIAREITAHYPGVVAVNAACNGQHSRWGLENFAALVLAKRPDVLFLEFAINDAVARFDLTLDEARRNLNAMLDQLSATSPACVVVLQIMNPVVDRPAGHDGHRPELSRYEQLYRDIARERNLLLVDHAPAWAALLATDEPNFRLYLPDGLHPTAAAYEQFMLPTLRVALGLPSARAQ